MRLGTLRPSTSTPTTAVRRAGAALAATALLLGATACSGDEEPDQDPAASAEPSESVPTAEPGPEVEARTATFAAPEGFEVAKTKKKSQAVIATGPAGNLVTVVELDFPGEAPTLERQAEIAASSLGDKFTVGEPVEVDGVEMWHLSGKESKGSFADVYGAVVDGTAVRLTLRLANDEYDTAQRAAVNQQVLDSWTWGA